MIELITGHAGVNHIDSEDMRALHRGIFGNGNFLLEGSADEKISPSMSVRVPALELMLDGSHMRTDGTDTLSFLSTTQGATRNDYICARYKNTGGLETAELLVVNESDLLNTFDIVDYPLYKCVVSGSSMQSVTCVLFKIKSFNTDQTSTDVLQITKGGTGGKTAAEARQKLGLNSIFATETVISASFTIDNSKTKNVTVALPAKSGYEPVAVVGWEFADSASFDGGIGGHTYSIYFTMNKVAVGSKNLALTIYNSCPSKSMTGSTSSAVGGDSKTGILSLTVLYVKTL